MINDDSIIIDSEDVSASMSNDDLNGSVGSGLNSTNCETQLGNDDN